MGGACEDTETGWEGCTNVYGTTRPAITTSNFHDTPLNRHPPFSGIMASIATRLMNSYTTHLFAFLLFLYWFLIVAIASLLPVAFLPFPSTAPLSLSTG